MFAQVRGHGVCVADRARRGRCAAPGVCFLHRPAGGAGQASRAGACSGVAGLHDVLQHLPDPPTPASPALARPCRPAAGALPACCGPNQTRRRAPGALIGMPPGQGHPCEGRAGACWAGAAPQGHGKPPIYLQQAGAGEQAAHHRLRHARRTPRAHHRSTPPARRPACPSRPMPAAAWSTAARCRPRQPPRRSSRPSSCRRHCLMSCRQQPLRAGLPSAGERLLHAAGQRSSATAAGHPPARSCSSGSHQHQGGWRDPPSPQRRCMCCCAVTGAAGA